MGTPVVVNGSTYTVPAYGDEGWAQGSGSLPNLLIALSAAVATSPAFMETVSVASSPQSVTTGKTYLVNTAGGAITMNLPAPASNVWFMIKDINGNAGTNNITLHRNGSEEIDGIAADATLNVPYALTIVCSDGTDWFILLNV